MIQLNNGEIVAVKKDLDTLIDVGVNGMFMGTKKPVIYLNDKRVYPEPNTAVAIDGSQITVPDKFRYFTVDFVNFTYNVTYSDGGDKLLADGSNYAMVDFPFLIFDSEANSILTWLFFQDFVLYELNYNQMPTGVVFSESLYGNASASDMRIEQVSDPSLPRTEQNKWRIYGVNLETTVKPAKGALLRVTYEDYYGGNLDMEFQYPSNITPPSAAGKTAIDSSYNAQTKKTTIYKYPVILLEGNNVTETLVLDSIESDGLRVSSGAGYVVLDTGQSEPYQEIPFDRTYNVTQSYTSGRIVNIVRTIYFDEEDMDTYPSGIFTYSLSPGNASWLSIAQNGQIYAQENQTILNRSTEITISFDDGIYSGSATTIAPVSQWRCYADYRFPTFYGSSNSPAYIKVVNDYNPSSPYNLQYYNSEYKTDCTFGGNVDYIEVTVSAATASYRWVNGSSTKNGSGVFDYDSHHYEEDDTYDDDDILDTPGKCAYFNRESTLYMRVSNGNEAIDGNNYNGDEIYVYCYIDGDENEVIDVSNTSNGGGSYETLVIGQETYRMFILHPFIVSDKVYYRFYIICNGDASDITDGTSVVFNFFRKTATKSNSGGVTRYVENASPNNINTMSINGSRVYGSNINNNITVSGNIPLFGEKLSIDINNQ